MLKRIVQTFCVNRQLKAFMSLAEEIVSHKTEVDVDIQENKRKFSPDDEPIRSKIRRKAEDPELDSPMPEPVFFFENGLRKVKPYLFTYKAYAKRRWLGRELLEVYNKEFSSKPESIFSDSIKDGRITVNGKPISDDYRIKDLDVIRHCTHRHELPVPDVKIVIVHEDDELLVIDKPAGIPVHPCGRYYNNSITSLLQLEHGHSNLRGLYRLDRTTSGLLIFSKNLALDQKLKSNVRDRVVKKLYLAEVEGIFPSEEVTVEKRLDTLIPTMGVQFIVESGGKPCKSVFKRLATKGNNSIILCCPETGRTHQLRVHLQYLGHPIVNDSIYNSEDFGPEKGRNGNYGDLKEVRKAVEESHSYLKWVERKLSKDAPQISEKEDYKDFCPECHMITKDPPLEALQINLHCFGYKIDKYQYHTNLPKWADVLVLEDLLKTPDFSCYLPSQE